MSREAQNGPAGSKALRAQRQPSADRTRILASLAICDRRQITCAPKNGRPQGRAPLRCSPWADCLCPRGAPGLWPGAACKAGPAQPHRAVVRKARLALGGLCLLGGRLGLLRPHQRAHFGVGCQDAMAPDQMQPRPWHQRCQPLHEPRRRHHQVGGAAAPGCLELEYHLPGGVGLHAFVGHCRSGDVAAQLLQRLPVVGRAILSCFY